MRASNRAPPAASPTPGGGGPVTCAPQSTCHCSCRRRGACCGCGCGRGAGHARVLPVARVCTHKVCGGRQWAKMGEKGYRTYVVRRDAKTRGPRLGPIARDVHARGFKPEGGSTISNICRRGENVRHHHTSRVCRVVYTHVEHGC